LRQLPKFWLVCLIITGWTAWETIVTGNRRRSKGIFLTCGGMCKPDN